jgi:hypothetical protein
MEITGVMFMSKITQSVGKGGMNLPVDVNYVQQLLNHKLGGLKLLNPLLVADGDCGKKTIGAIHILQDKVLKFAHPDDLIQPNKTSITKLMEGIPQETLTKMWNKAVMDENPPLAALGSVTTVIQSNKPLPPSIIANPGYSELVVTPGQYSFPLPVLPKQTYTSGGTSFGYKRDNGARKHAGCDLVVPAGTPVCAIADGVVHRDPYYFYNGSYALEVNHGTVLVRYGEIAPTAVLDPGLSLLPEIKDGAKIKKGQVIGHVTRMTGGSSMVHFECYSNPHLKGALTDRSKSGGAFKRRSDLINPTNLLENAKSFLPPAQDNLDDATLKAVIDYGHGKAKAKGY